MIILLNSSPKNGYENLIFKTARIRTTQLGKWEQNLSAPNNRKRSVKTLLRHPVLKLNKLQSWDVVKFDSWVSLICAVQLFIHWLWKWKTFPFPASLRISVSISWWQTVSIDFYYGFCETFQIIQWFRPRFLSFIHPLTNLNSFQLYPDWLQIRYIAWWCMECRFECQTFELIWVGSSVKYIFHSSGLSFRRVNASFQWQCILVWAYLQITSISDDLFESLDSITVDSCGILCNDQTCLSQIYAISCFCIW